MLSSDQPALPSNPPYLLPIKVLGNPDLKETLLDAYEVGYTGVLAGRTVLSASFYTNKTKNDIFFTESRGQPLDGHEPAAELALILAPAVISPRDRWSRDSRPPSRT